MLLGTHDFLLLVNPHVFEFHCRQKRSGVFIRVSVWSSDASPSHRAWEYASARSGQKVATGYISQATMPVAGSLPTGRKGG